MNFELTIGQLACIQDALKLYTECMEGSELKNVRHDAHYASLLADNLNNQLEQGIQWERYMKDHFNIPFNYPRYFGKK